MKKRTKYLTIVIVVLIIVLGSIYGLTYAKYVANSIWNYYLESKGFYFSSDMLDSNGINHVNNNWDGNRIRINIKNSKNDSLITDYDINYQIECNIVDDTSKKCIINDCNSSVTTDLLKSKKECSQNKELNSEECINQGYDMKDIEVSNDVYISIKNNDNTELDDQTDVVVNIKITATSPYSTYLSGNFTLHKNINYKDGIAKKIIDSDDNIEYIISNYNSFDKCLNLSWNSTDLKIDVNPNDVLSYQLDENNYLNQITINLLNHTDINYTFYKSNLNKSYNLSNFILTELSNCS